MRFLTVSVIRNHSNSRAGWSSPLPQLLSFRICFGGAEKSGATMIPKSDDKDHPLQVWEAMADMAREHGSSVVEIRPLHTSAQRKPMISENRDKLQ
jgi:hypothetical protein